MDHHPTVINETFDRPRSNDAAINQPPRKKTRYHKGRDLHKVQHPLVQKRILENPGQSLRDPGNGKVECQACAKQMKPDKTTVSRHLGFDCFLFIFYILYIFKSQCIII